MAQYKSTTANGLTVSVTNGSQTVTGSGTAFNTEATAGDIFTIVDHGAWYEIASVDSDTQLTLAANYAGVTDTQASFVITRDFTANLGLPYPTKGDIETASLVKRSFVELDDKVNELDTTPSVNSSTLNAITTTLSGIGSTVATFFYIPALMDSDGGLAAKSANIPAALFGTVESGTVTLWDITGASPSSWNTISVLSDYTSAKMVGGKLVLGSAASGVWVHDFNLAGRITQYTTSGSRDRGPTTGDGSTTGPLDATRAIVNDAVNAVAVTALDTSPIDPETELIKPSVAAFTAAGISVIKDDGSVIDGSSAASYGDGAITADGRLWWTHSAAANCGLSAPINELANSFNPQSVIDFNVGSTPARLPGNGTVVGVGTRHIYHGNASGFEVLTPNFTDASKSMVNYITTTYNTGHMLGNTLGAYLCDSATGNITGSELVVNGTFDTDTTGWSALLGATLSVDTQRLKVLNTAAAFGGAEQAISLSAGTYTAAVNYDHNGSNTASYFQAGVASDDNSIFSVTTGTVGTSATGVLSYTFTLSSTTTVYIQVQIANTNGINGLFDNITIRPASPDRYVTNNGAAIHGTLSRTRQGAISLYGGWGTGNYAEVADVSAYATSTLFIPPFPLVVAPNVAQEHFVNIASHNGSWQGAFLRLAVTAAGALVVDLSDDGATTVDTVNGPTIDDLVPRTVSTWFDGDNLYLRVDGVVYSVAQTNAANGLTTLDANASLMFGRQQNDSSPLPATNCKFGLIRPTSSIPTTEQIEAMEAQVHAFLNASEAVIDGASDSVLAHDHDRFTKLTGVSTSSGITYFDRHGVQVSTASNLVGTPQSLSMLDGHILQGGSTGAHSYIPPKNLRDKEIEEAQTIGMEVFFFDGDASTTDFALPVGWKPVAVYDAGALKRPGPSDDYEALNDGHKYTISFAVAPGSGNDIGVMARRVQ